MIEPSRLSPAHSTSAGALLRPLALVAAISCTLVAGSVAQAQITTKMLIEDSVSEIGNKYGDIDDAIKRFTNGDVIAARQFLESAKRKDPNLPPVDLLMAKMYFLAQNPNSGRFSLEKTALENPEDPEAYLILADQAAQQNRMIEADALYERGMAITANFKGNAKRKRNLEIRARGGRSAIAQRRKNWEAAVADLKAILAADPDNAMAHYRLGQALFMQKQFQDGIKELTAAKKAEKSLPDPNVAAALMFDQLKDSAKAQQAFDLALSQNKTDVNTITQYAQWLIRSGTPENLTKAEGMLTEARKANPGNLNLLILSGVVARMQKKAKPAEDYFVEAHAIAPANTDAVGQLALLLIEQPDEAKKQRALEFAAICSQLNQQNADAQFTLAWVLYQLGRANDADQALKAGLRLNNPSPDSTYLVAKMLLGQQKPDAAKQLLQSALDQDYPGIFVNRKDAQAELDKLK